MRIRELDWAERRDWLRLIRTPRIGPVTFRDLMARYGSAAEIIDALPNLTRLSGFKLPPIDEIEHEMDAHQDRGIRILAACEPDYPALLRAIDPPPPLISVWGDTEILRKPCVAIVGSRNASAIGQRFAGQLATDLGEAGVSVISGLARGIDTSAHHGALSTGTAAVLGGGADHVYPRQNADLFERIKEHGALISESPLGHRATARDFPRRNRIISGLSLGVVVVEAAERSGTLITARYALEQNREVMAAPGSPLDPRTKGCNRLIRDGAALIENAGDVLDIIQPLAHRPPPVQEPREPVDFRIDNKDISDVSQRLRALLSPTPTARDTLIRACDMPAPLVNAALLEMELAGDIHVEPDGRVSYTSG